MKTEEEIKREIKREIGFKIIKIFMKKDCPPTLALEILDGLKQVIRGKILPTRNKDEKKEKIEDGLAVILIQELANYTGEVLKLEDFYRIAKRQAEWLKEVNHNSHVTSQR